MVDDAPWLLVGLGNPDAEGYADTRHNLGAKVVTRLAQRVGERLKRSKNRAHVAELRHQGRKVILARPDSYVNLSGGPVSLLARYYKTPPSQVVVIYDEIDLPAGKLQVRKGGGTAGHNGLKDVVKALGTPDFIRVRLGVGRPPGRQDPADYVLEPIPKRLSEEIGVLIERAADAAIDLVTMPVDEAQNRHNG